MVWYQRNAQKWQKIDFFDVILYTIHIPFMSVYVYRTNMQGQSQIVKNAIINDFLQKLSKESIKMEGKEFKYILNRAGITFKEWSDQLKSKHNMLKKPRTVASWQHKREVGELQVEFLKRDLGKELVNSLRAEFQELKKARLAAKNTTKDS